MVLDASNSMNSQLEGATRLEVLKRALSQIAPAQAGRLDLGLLAFGNRQERSCTDTQTLVAPAADGAEKIAAAAAGITARGVSLVAPALQAAANDLDYLKQPAAIVLVADSAGVENCRIDTCAAARALADEAKALTIHVIAFSAKPEEAVKLQCIATETGGVYHAAGNGAELAVALQAAFAAAAATPAVAVTLAPPPRAKPRRLASAPAREDAPSAGTAAAAGDAQDGAKDGAEAAADAGAETDTAEEAPAEVVVASGKVVPPPRPKPDFVDGSGGETPGTTNVSVFAPTGAGTATPAAEEAARLAARDAATGESNESVMAPSASTRSQDTAGAAASDDTEEEMATASVDAAGDGGDGGETVLAPPGAPQARQEPAAPRLPAGPPISTTRPAPARTTVLVKARAEPEVAGAADQQTPTAPAASGPPGRLKLAAYIVANTKPIPSGMLWQVMEVRPGGAAGNLVARVSEATPEIELPAGDYIVRAVFGQASRSQPVTVKRDTTAEANVVLDAGGLQIVAQVAGGEVPDEEVRNTIYRVGDSQPLVRDTLAGTVIYLTAGTYRVESRYGAANAIASVELEVQPGKLVKGKIDHRAGSAAFRLVPEGGGRPLGGTVWQVLAPGGRVVTQSTEPTPTYVFAAGAYDLIVQHGGKTYRSSFDVKAGQPTSVEVVAR
jgi:hypothetical protein